MMLRSQSFSHVDRAIEARGETFSHEEELFSLALKRSTMKLRCVYLKTTSSPVLLFTSHQLGSGFQFNFKLIDELCHQIEDDIKHGRVGVFPPEQNSLPPSHLRALPSNPGVGLKSKGPPRW